MNEIIFASMNAFIGIGASFLIVMRHNKSRGISKLWNLFVSVFCGFVGLLNLLFLIGTISLPIEPGIVTVLLIIVTTFAVIMPTEGA